MVLMMVSVLVTVMVGDDNKMVTVGDGVSMVVVVVEV